MKVLVVASLLSAAFAHGNRKVVMPECDLIKCYEPTPIELIPENIKSKISEHWEVTFEKSPECKKKGFWHSIGGVVGYGCDGHPVKCWIKTCKSGDEEFPCLIENPDSLPTEAFNATNWTIGCESPVLTVDVHFEEGCDGSFATCKSIKLAGTFNTGFEGCCTTDVECDTQDPGRCKENFCDLKRGCQVRKKEPCKPQGSGKCTACGKGASDFSLDTCASFVCKDNVGEDEDEFGNTIPAFPGNCYFLGFNQNKPCQTEADFLIDPRCDKCVDWECVINDDYTSKWTPNYGLVQLPESQP